MKMRQIDLRIKILRKNPAAGAGCIYGFWFHREDIKKNFLGFLGSNDLEKSLQRLMPSLETLLTVGGDFWKGAQDNDSINQKRVRSEEPRGPTRSECK